MLSPKRVKTKVYSTRWIATNEAIGERLGIEKGERVLAFFVYWLPVFGCQCLISGCL
jgi:hypothetical protein